MSSASSVLAFISYLLPPGTYVVCDRYAFSGVAYTAAKGLSFDWCKNPDIGLPTPDRVFYLDIDPEAAKARAEYGNERYEKLEFQKKLGAQFKEFAVDKSFWKAVEANRDMDVITSEIIAEVEKIDSELPAGAPIAKLWVGEEAVPAMGA